MSHENVDRVRQGIEAFNRRDFDAALAMLSDDIIWERFLSQTESATPPSSMLGRSPRRMYA